MAGYGHESHMDKALHMDFWLTIGRWSDAKPRVRVTAEYPKTLDHGEITMNFKMKLPVALFARPSLVANIDIAAPSQPVTIDISAVAAAVSAALGCDVEISVKEPEA